MNIQSVAVVKSVRVDSHGQIVVELELSVQDLILAEVLKTKGQLNDMKLDLQALRDAVARETTVDNSVLALVQQMAANQASLAQQLADAIANNDPAAIAAVQAELDSSAAAMNANADKLVSAVQSNTTP